MYKTIYVPVDNSDYSNQAIASAVELGKACFDDLVAGISKCVQMEFGDK